MKILISAYACRPNKGSEPGVGWNWVKQVGRFHEVWVITRSTHCKIIEKTLAKNLMPNVHWIYYDLPGCKSFWKEGGRGVHFYYYLWQVGVYFVCKRLHREVGLDIVHHLTYGGYWLPSFLSLLPIPFIWGPLGGGESTPKAFFQSFNLRNRVFEKARILVQRIGEIEFSVRLSARRATAVLAKTRETAQRLHLLGTRRIHVYSESGITKEELETFLTQGIHEAQPKSFRIVSAGRILYWKGFHLGLKAFARFHRIYPNSEYVIIGDGPELTNLKHLSQEFGISNNVNFLGKLTRENTLKTMASCHILLHPSLHDSGGWVCLEAMSIGLPVICLDLGGPALQVTDKTGFKIMAISSEQAIKDLADAAIKLVSDPDLRQSMSEAAHCRVRDYFNWDKKGEWINALYQKIMKEKRG